MTQAQADAHQAKHGFIRPLREQPEYRAALEAARKSKDEMKSIPKPRMNKSEAAFALILEAMKRKTEIASYQFEGITLRLADRCKFTPDFFVVVSASPLKIRFCEVKGGHIWDDAKVKFRVARELYSWAEWQMWQKSRSGWNQIA